MKREEYNKCIAGKMRGRKAPTPGERRQIFCQVAKVCSGKAKNEDDALEL